MADHTHFHGLTFEIWCARLDEYHEKLRRSGEIEGYGPGSVVTSTGSESWKQYYDTGYSPEDALDEDRTYWED